MVNISNGFMDLIVLDIIYDTKFKCQINHNQ